MEWAQLWLSFASLVALGVIGWATFRTERRSATEAARERRIRRLEDVYRSLLEVQDVLGRPPQPQGASVSIVTGPVITNAYGLADKEAWEAYLRERDAAIRGLEACLPAVAGFWAKLPSTVRFVEAADIAVASGELAGAIEEVRALLSQESEAASVGE